MLKKGVNYFNHQWLNEEFYPEFNGWLFKISEFEAGCSICQKVLNLQCGILTLKTHVRSQRHVNNVNLGVHLQIE